VIDYLRSIFLGIIEGLTEFLPVSSTAHLRIGQKLVGINLDDGYWKMYAIVIQLGAIISVVVYFRQEIMRFLRNFPRGARGDRNLFNHPLTLTLVAFVATAIPAKIMKDNGTIEKNLENLWLMGTSLLIGGIVMWAVDAIFRKPTTLEMERMSLPQAIWVGLVQILSAVFPGTSRSMSTIAAGQTSGMSREAALEFSFFLCIPTMFAATGKELYDTVFPKIDHTRHMSQALQMTGHEWGVLLVGFVVSFFVAWAVIAWFMAWVRRRGFMPFAIYRILLGLGVLVAAKYGVL
jgi:undecaprenyl-diphosphatase